MNISDYQYITINGIELAYLDNAAAGKTFLLLHGFSSFAYTWEALVSRLPRDFRFIRPDLKGFGYSDKVIDDRLTPFDQALLVGEFIKQLDLRDLVLVGHSMGGAVALCTMLEEDIRPRVSQLVLIDSAGLFHKIPPFVEDISMTSSRNPLLRYVNQELMAYLVLKQIYFKDEHITEETIKAYGEMLRQPGITESLINAARQMEIANVKAFQHDIGKLRLPTLILWGEEDAVIDVEDAFLFRSCLPGAELKIIPACGHSPQEELPAETARLLADFVGFTLPEPQPATNPAVATAAPEPTPEPAVATQPPEEKAAATATAAPEPRGNGENRGGIMRSVEQFRQASDNYIRELRMRRLVDHWSIGAFLLIIFIKLLQILKKLGFKAEENGWRKATGIFLRNEYSKFVLASFRLRYYRDDRMPADFDSARALLTERLGDFIRRQTAFHWSVELGLLRVGRKKVYFTDIVEVWYDHDGLLQRIEPHFDNTRSTFSFLSPEQIDMALRQIIACYNDLRHLNDRQRPITLYRRLFKWSCRAKGLSLSCRQELFHLIDRVLTATIIQCEVLDFPPDQLNRARLATPNLKNRKHPGLGLLNIICRFTADYQEVDMWFQYHHVPVDGMPMQEILEQLKKDWGAAGQMLYPAFGSRAAMPEVFYFGNRVFRARIYIYFDKLLALRKYINDHYYHQMEGPATIASMIIWGLARHRYFRDRKFLFPVDAATDEYPQERNLGLIFIRPNHFTDKAKPLDGFLRFQREFNQRLFATRMGKSESYELLELYSMIHPAFYHIAKHVMSKAMSEIVGTVGLSVIKNAEMFVSPLTDLQANGFMTIGNLMMPTEDGRFAGAVSICGSREEIRFYIEAANTLSNEYHRFLGLPEPEQK